jgi:hypothetical protein
MLLQSGSRQSPTSSRWFHRSRSRNSDMSGTHLVSPEAEASFDSRPHLGAEAPRCVPVRNRNSVQVRNSTRGLPSADLVKAGLPREVVPPAETVGRAIRVSPSRWRPSVSRSDHREVSQPPAFRTFALRARRKLRVPMPYCKPERWLLFAIYESFSRPAVNA